MIDDKYQDERRVWQIVNADNYDGDYPDEKSVNIPYLSKKDAQQIADILNNAYPNCHRYWKVESKDYKLQPGFEP